MNYYFNYKDVELSKCSYRFLTIWWLQYYFALLCWYYCCHWVLTRSIFRPWWLKMWVNIFNSTIYLNYRLLGSGSVSRPKLIKLSRKDIYLTTNWWVRSLSKRVHKCRKQLLKHKLLLVILVNFRLLKLRIR